MNENIRPGDILVFAAGDDWISKSIAFLTNSTVSHTAMLLAEDTMVEMCPGGIATSRFHQSQQGRRTYFMRLEPEQDPLPLLRAAQGYLDEEMGYDYPALFLLAGLLIYHNVRPTWPFHKIADLILHKVCLQLDQWIQQILHSGKKTMVCSQMVYQCYLDCGVDYYIYLQDGDLQILGDESSVRLIDLLDALPEAGNAVFSTPLSPLLEETDDLELARQLYAALTVPEKGESLITLNQMRNLTPVVEKFLTLVKKLLETVGSNIPMEALFVTPGDLLNHTKNLRQICEYPIERQ